MILNRSKYNLYFLIIIVYWLTLWGSINTLPSEILKIFENLLRTVNALRLLIPLIVSIFLIIYITFKYSKKIKLEIKYYNVFLLFIIFYVFQSLGWINSFSPNNIYNDLHLLILGCGAIAIIFMIYIQKKEFLLKYLLFISLFIITLVSIYFFLATFKEESIKNFSYFYGAFVSAKVEATFYQDPPRITGLSRNFSVLNIFSICIYFYLFKKNNFLKNFFILLIPIITFIIWGLQSRGSIICFFLASILLIFFQKKISNKKKFVCLFFFIILPILTYQTFIYKFQEMNVTTEPKTKITFDETFYLTRVFGVSNTSGRFQIWENLLNQYNKNRIFGYGPQADRHMVNKSIDEKYGNNASNSFLYSFVCGGYFGLLIFITINFFIIRNILRCILENKIFEDSKLWIVQAACTILFFFIIRGLVENSFALFSIDFLIVIISFSIINSFNFNKKL
jgi:hypothetical protein